MSDAPFSTTDMFTWLNQVRADEGLPVRSFVVAFTLAQHCNRRTGLAFPSQELLVVETRLNERTVRDAIRALETHGHLAVGSLQGRGRGFRRTYRPTIKTGKILPVSGSGKPASFTGFTDFGKPAKSRSQTGKMLPVSIEPSQNQESPHTGDVVASGGRR